MRHRIKSKRRNKSKRTGRHSRQKAKVVKRTVRRFTGPIQWDIHRRTAAIVSAMNEEKTLPLVLSQLIRLPLTQLILVVNGSTDQTLDVARACQQATVVYYPEALGHDVGRSIGAKLTDAEILLFLDADIVVKAESLLPFVRSIDRGADVALNDITPFVGSFAKRDGVSIMKEFLNCSLGRDDLRMNSMTAVPFALSRHALETIGADRLAVPPLAHALAIQFGLHVETAGKINVIRRNKLRKENTGQLNPVSRLIIGDHWEALHEVMMQQGSRLQYPDLFRDRETMKDDLF